MKDTMKLYGITKLPDSFWESDQGKCPECKKKLRIVRHFSSGVPFIGCKGYSTYAEGYDDKKNCKYVKSIPLMKHSCGGDIYQVDTQQFKCSKCDWKTRDEPVDHKCDECGHEYLLLFRWKQCNDCNFVQVRDKKCLRCGGWTGPYKRIECPDCGTRY